MRLIVEIILFFIDLAWTALCFVFWGTSYLLKLFWRLTVIQFSSKDIEGEIAMTEEVSSHKSSPVSATNSAPSEVLEKRPLNDIIRSYKANHLQVVPLVDIGNLTLSTNTNDRISKRKITLDNTSLIDFLGKREILLNDLIVPNNVSSQVMSNFCYDQSLQDAQNVLNELIAVKNGTNNPVSSRVENSKVTEPPALIPQISSAAKLVDVPTQDHSIQKQKEVIVRDASRPIMKPKKQHFGRFEGSGWGRKPGASFNQFYVAFYSEEKNGGLDKLWGNDLVNALDLAKPNKGDRICVTSFGFHPITLANNEVKNVHKYDMSVIA